MCIIFFDIVHFLIYTLQYLKISGFNVLLKYTKIKLILRLSNILHYYLLCMELHIQFTHLIHHYWPSRLDHNC